MFCFIWENSLKYNSISAIVTKPFKFEGTLRSKVANETIEKSKINFLCIKYLKTSHYLGKQKKIPFNQAFDILNESIYEYIKTA